MSVDVINNTKFSINKKYFKNFLIDTILVSKIDGVTTLVFVDNDEIKRLSEKYTFVHWEQIDDNHSAVRFCTSWATKESDVDQLLADL